MPVSPVGGIIAAASLKTAVPMLQIGSISIIERIVITFQQAGIRSSCPTTLFRKSSPMTVKTDCGALKEDYLRAYSARMALTQGRVSAEYRKAACMNLLEDFLAKFCI